MRVTAYLKVPNFSLIHTHTNLHSRNSLKLSHPPTTNTERAMLSMDFNMMESYEMPPMDSSSSSSSYGSTGSNYNSYSGSQQQQMGVSAGQESAGYRK